MTSTEILKLWADRGTYVVREAGQSDGRLKDAHDKDVVVKVDGKEAPVVIAFSELESLHDAGLITEAGRPGFPEVRIYRLKKT